YHSALLDAPDPWLRDALLPPVPRSYPFTITGLASAAEPAHLTVRLQGASDYPADPDHHVRAYLNGSLVGETSWDGKMPARLEADFPAEWLREGDNQLDLENVGDTVALNSMVFLDRFDLRYPRQAAAVGGVLHGR